jgi:hypothetical protein
MIVIVQCSNGKVQMVLITSIGSHGARGFKSSHGYNSSNGSDVSNVLHNFDECLPCLCIFASVVFSVFMSCTTI